MKNLTPMMKQYKEIKDKYNDCILFFRLGDFYEMFLDDAIVASRELEITLTQRGIGGDQKAPMCGVPHHVAESYISKLVEKGYKVAVCEQLEDPSEAKGIVERDVVRVVTPGTITDINSLDEKTNNYLASIFFDNTGVGFSYVDTSTGQMYTTELISDIDTMEDFILDELGKIFPSEIICNKEFTNNNKLIEIIENTIDPYINVFDDKIYREYDWALKIVDHFNLKDIRESDLKGKVYSTVSTGKLIDYLYETQKDSLEHINSVQFFNSKEYMVLDLNTRINLEIHETIMKRNKKGALIWLLDKTSTAMGGRLLKNWLEQPLLNKKEIKSRQEIVELFVDDIILMDKVKECLKKIYDLERLASKISYGNCNARDLDSLKISLSKIPELKQVLIQADKKELIKIASEIDSLRDIYELIDKSIIESPPISIKEGGLIKDGYNTELDELRKISTSGKQWLTNLEKEEKSNTGIRNLKIGFNKKSGYFFEVTKSNYDLVPDYFIRKQTLTNSERYHTNQLKEFEHKIIGAEEKIVDLEYDIFQDLRLEIKSQTNRIQMVSKLISRIDVLNSFAQVAYNNDYIRPNLNYEGKIEIIDGRHPVVEETMTENMFVPNDTLLDNEDNMIKIITGPNMAGKSTYMRQVAIIVLMAQIGSFIPAKEANIGIVDRIFTRIGAADNLSQGKSTFMVEMSEVSNILKNATKNSFIILDEVGRGTSTYDGLSIAWAIVEYISKNTKAKTLFATHYHELTQLEDELAGVKNLTILVEEQGDEVIFLRKIAEGSTDRSYGIHVAKLAGIDDSIIDRSNEILHKIEHDQKLIGETDKVKEPTNYQYDFSDYKKNYFIKKIKNLDISNITPIEAINTLYELVEESKALEERPNEKN